jgi:O6-methylguanine-DNA--protein-cysteine methyltransferase
MEVLNYMHFTSRVGPLFLAASKQGLVALEFDQRIAGQQTIRPNPRDLRAESKSVRFEESERVLSPYIRELEEYFAGSRREFSFPLDLRGTEFQVACWRALLKIPYGDPLLRGYRPRGWSPSGFSRRRHGK